MTFDIEKLKTLKDRIDAAPWPDRELTLDIWLSMPFVKRDGGLVYVNNEGYKDHFYTTHFDDCSYDLPDILSSLDEALKLIGTLLPEANCYGFEKEPKGITAYVLRNCLPSMKIGMSFYKEGFHKTSICHAFLSAFLEALIAREEGSLYPLTKNATRFQNFSDEQRAIIPDEAPKQFSALNTRELIAKGEGK